MHAAAVAAGVPIIRIHDLRHSHASYLINNNVPILAISRRLGHASPAITLNVYSHLYERTETEVNLMLENIVKQ